MKWSAQLSQNSTKKFFFFFVGIREVMDFWTKCIEKKGDYVGK